jgi:hypothetical protein
VLFLWCRSGEEGEREAVRKRMERKDEKGSEEDDYFNKFPPTMPSVVLENRSIRKYYNNWNGHKL